MKNGATHETRLAHIEKFVADKDDVCYDFYETLRTITEDSEIAGVIVMGEHFSINENASLSIEEKQRKAERTLPSIETVFIAAGDSTEGYYRKFGDYVDKLWDLGIKGSIDVLSEKTIENTGGTENWLTGRLPARKLMAAHG